MQKCGGFENRNKTPYLLLGRQEVRNCSADKCRLPEPTDTSLMRCRKRAGGHPGSPAPLQRLRSSSSDGASQLWGPRQPRISFWLTQTSLLELAQVGKLTTAYSIANMKVV